MYYINDFKVNNIVTLAILLYLLDMQEQVNQIKVKLQLEVQLLLVFLISMSWSIIVRIVN